jgi:EF-hand domain pair/EF hand
MRVLYHFAYRLFACVLISTAGAAALAQAPRPATTARPPATTARPPAQAPRPAASDAEPISRASFIATMDGEYRKLDANNDGVVTKIELEASQQRAKAAALTQQARELFVRFDTDHNGQLSLNEFVYATSGGPQARPNVTPMMTRLDANRDNKVTLVEYRTVTLTGFDRMDTDKDGVVSVAEQRAGGLIK